MSMDWYAAHLQEDGLKCNTWKTGKDVMKWWLGEQAKPDDGGNISLYGLRLDETDT